MLACDPDQASGEFVDVTFFVSLSGVLEILFGLRAFLLPLG